MNFARATVLSTAMAALAACAVLGPGPAGAAPGDSKPVPDVQLVPAAPPAPAVMPGTNGSQTWTLGAGNGGTHQSPGTGGPPGATAPSNSGADAPATPQEPKLLLPPGDPRLWGQTRPGACMIGPVVGARPCVEFPPTPEVVADAATVAAQAVTAMQLDPPPMLFAPGTAETTAVGVTGLHAWAWINPALISDRTVGPVHRTAAAPGVVVTLNAVNTGVLINWGDGSVPTFCAGALLPFTPYLDALDVVNPLPMGTPSPTCGHHIQKSSITEPDKMFHVSATSLWVVNWSAVTPAGPVSGVIPSALTSNYRHRIGEVQVLVNGLPAK